MNYINFLFKKAIYAHLLVPFWMNRRRRRHIRARILAELCERYVRDLPVVVPQDVVPERLTREYVFSMWLQGEEQAPRIVKSCWESIRRYSTEELVVLDADNIKNWIDIPEGFLARWQKGEIKPCHFSDFCRVELLWKYGGYWMDATDYMCRPMPEFIVEQPFFIYLGDEEGYSPFIQNCFIRAYAHHPIIGAWREIIRTYWAQHSRAFDYFLPHRLFYHMVLSNDQISEQFAQMPHICHDCTHVLWWGGYRGQSFDEEILRRLASEAAFQKLEYKSLSARSPWPGTLADYIVNRMVMP